MPNNNESQIQQATAAPQAPVQCTQQQKMALLNGQSRKLTAENVKTERFSNDYRPYVILGASERTKLPNESGPQPVTPVIGYVVNTEEGPFEALAEFTLFSGSAYK